MSTAPTSSATSPPPTPRPSASLVIVNHRNEILLVRRNPKARSFGGMHVFPGGNFDKKQDASLAITAIRETFEESGLLLASPANSSQTLSVSGEVLDEARFAIHQQKRLFQEFLSELNLKADVESLLPFTQWITPVGPPRRFQTQFYVAFLSPSSASSFSSGEKEERRPTPDGGQEVVAARFVHPSDVLAESASGKIGLMPPQYYIISTLSEILNGAVSTADQRAQVKTLSEGQFGRMVINPVAFGQDGLGRGILTFEGDETRGGSKGRLHRSFLKMGKGTTKISLERNFNIFTEIESAAFNTSPPAKL